MNKNILIIPYSFQLGSTHTLIQIGLYLRKAGYNVIFAGEGYYLNLASKEDFPTYKLSEIPYDKYREQTDKANLDYLNQEQIDQFVKEEMEIYAEHNIDLVIDTLRPTTYISTKISNIKRISLTYAVLTKYNPLVLGIPESHVLSASESIPLVYDFICKMSKPIRDIVYKNCASEYVSYMNRINLKYLRSITYEDLIEGDKTFVYDVQEFYPMKDEPQEFIYTGALLYKLAAPKPKWLKEVTNRKRNEKAKIIYLSMGSSGIMYPKIIRFLNQYTKDHPEYIVISNSLLHELEDEIDSPNVYMTDFAAADDMLTIADLVISHGGKGTIYHSLKYGIPLIGIPHQAEQEWNLNRCEELQVGLKCSKKKFTIELLKEKLETLLDDYNHYLMNSRKFIDIIASYNSERIVIDTVNKMLKSIK